MNNKNNLIFITVISVVMLITHFLLGLNSVLGIISSTFFIIAFYLVDRIFKIKFKIVHYIIIMIIIILGMLIGEYAYFIYPNFDKILHLTLPFFGAVVIYYALGKSDLKFKYRLLLTFTSIITFLTLQEIVEYILDVLLNAKLQGVFISQQIENIKALATTQSRIDDTMWDLIYGFISSLAFVLYSVIKRNS